MVKPLSKLGLSWCTKTDADYLAGANAVAKASTGA